jgi:phenylpropionate dioxygenase-like ring-hydroxylating dioxygenase large terminal subunit
LPDHYSDDALRSLVRPDAVHRRVYTDPGIFVLERERIFKRAWLYVGHGSQIARPGDFFTTDLAGQPVVLVRHADGTPRVLFNRCGHRGAKVVAERCGNATAFVCCYHAWTYATDGRLISAPIHQDERAGDFDLADPSFSMVPLPRVASYRGFVFASFAAEGPSLEAALGGVRAVFDNMVDRAPSGELHVAGGCLKLVQNANWKILLENVHDGLHPMAVHQSSIAASHEQARGLSGEPPFTLKVVMANRQTHQQMDRLAINAFERGHSYMAGFRDPRSDDPLFRNYAAALERAQGKQRAEEILARNYHNAIFYPNASAQPAFLQMRVLVPLAVDRTRIEVWSLRLGGAPDELFERTIAYANTVHSPSSLIRPDDIEAYERVQQGLSAEGADWVSQHRDRGRDRRCEAGLAASALSDLSLRNQYRAWSSFMFGGQL